VSATDPPILVTGLSKGTIYTCTVTATNAVGTGPASGSSPPILVPATVPDAPLKPTVARGNAKITVTFTPRGSNGSPTTSFTATCTGVNSPSHASMSESDSPIVVTGLTNGVRYTCSVTATNGVGTSPQSPASAEVVPATVPGQPGTPTLTRGVGKILVKFSAPPTNGSSITHFTVTCTSSHVGVTGSHAGPSSPITVTGLTNGRTYTCNVTATNAVGTGPRSSDSASTIVGTAPAPPTIVSVAPGRAPGPTGPLGVSFKAGSNNGTPISSYRATCVPVLPGPTTHVVSSTGTPIMVTGLNTGKAYTCYVVAISASGTSGRSGTITATVGTPGAPKITSITPHGHGLTLTFVVPSSNGNLILRYHAICRSTNGGATANQFARSSPFPVNGLTPGGRYSCTLAAINDRGAGPAATSGFTRVPF
jgi:titin